MSMTQTFEASKPAPAAAAAQDDETVRLLVGGELGRQLGLTGDQLRIGLTLARNELARGASEDAFRTYAGLVLCEPANPDFQLGLANCASLIGAHHLAIQAASAVIALSPSNPRGFLICGRSCLAIGALDEAREDLADALRLAQAGGDDVAAAEARRLLDGISSAQA
jgi:Flp pilus assembly protein TadD